MLALHSTVLKPCSQEFWPSLPVEAHAAVATGGNDLFTHEASETGQSPQSKDSQLSILKASSLTITGIIRCQSNPLVSLSLHISSQAH